MKKMTYNLETIPNVMDHNFDGKTFIQTAVVMWFRLTSKGLKTKNNHVLVNVAENSNILRNVIFKRFPYLAFESAAY